jgi:hypothetical protein
MDLDPRRIPGMSLGELGLLLLTEAAGRADDRAANCIDVQSETGRHGQEAEVRQAVIEAWAWLHAQGLTVIRRESSTQHLVSVTRRGRKALAEGLDWVRRNPFQEA